MHVVMNKILFFLTTLWLSFWLPVFQFHHGVKGQSATAAQCNRSSPLTQNSLGQSPCDDAAALWGVCTGDATPWPPLPNGSQYSPPQPDLGEVNPCTCSSVVYVLASACGWCQNQNFTTWATWTTNCTTAQQTKGFPSLIPSGIAIPHWAYMDVSGFGGNFDPTIALQLGGTSDTASQTPINDVIRLRLS
ncbi:hypothetical protein JAAARDRAFT_399493 [Jaapia argillacea MUCL 33604]|uniref:Uncharacterized protein n=1 Tax=Jaapia argillacea MUCL 33604 TaxID=933084 RepID=A0A067PII8_9AGAM|nr:hypothetical protein JAAARDRAFT_399493 [Jaapia argillacea MUCL 33604]